MRPFSIGDWPLKTHGSKMMIGRVDFSPDEKFKVRANPGSVQTQTRMHAHERALVHARRDVVPTEQRMCT